MFQSVSFNVMIAAAMLVLAGLVNAQQTVSDEKRFQINRITEAPKIDGRLDAGEWNGAARISDLHEVEPIEFDTPSERTVWYFAYDDKTLFVAGYAYDSEPHNIAANTLRQGAGLMSDDRMSLIIDPFNNKRSGYTFTLNPHGVRQEGIYATATRSSDQWDGIWRGAATRVDDGWTMEMAIPFNTVTFDPNNDTWGINFYRRVVRKAERMAWQSRNGAVNPTVSGEMYGLQGLNQGIGLDIIPSASSIYSRDRETDLSDSDLDSSIDINYKITPSINGLITFNTDFAATQVDGRKLDLQRFSLFFPEKRAFFLTDFDIFQFGGIPTGGGSWNRAVGLRSGTNGLAFFSRRIGLTSERAPVDLIGGAKISGRLGDTDFGALYILQDEYATSTGDVVGQSDLMVARVSQGVLEESALGAIMTIGNPGGNTDSSLFGADFQYRNTRLGKNRSAEGRFWIQKSNNEDLEGDDLAWSATVSLPARLGLEGGFQIHEVQQNFDPALGFANRTGVRLYGGELGFRRNLSGNKFIREVSHGLEFTQWNFLDTGDIQTRKIEADFLSLRSQSGDWASFRLSYQTEGLLIGEQPLSGVGINIPDGDHDFLRWNAFVRSASFRPLQLQLSVQGGDYYDGKRLRVEPEISWRANEHLTFELSYGYNKYEFPNGQSAIARLVSFESEFAFNSKMSLVTLAQYDNLSEEIGINSRFRYNLTAGQDIWFVINHNMRRDSSLDDRFDFRSIDSLAVAKVRYTFRY